jgi:hypothetical protein
MALSQCPMQCLIDNANEDDGKREEEKKKYRVR